MSSRLRRAVTLFGLGLVATAAAQPPPVIDYRYRVIARYPHPGLAFTQGLIVSNGALVESSGGYRTSYLQRYRPGTDVPAERQKLPTRWFAEGLAQLDERLWVLTWHAGKALIFNAATLRPQSTLAYTGEGWGLASDGRQLVMSDGSATLTFRRSDDFAVIRRLTVTLHGRPVGGLNELEWVRGWILANVWQTDRIVIIDPATGTVHGRIDLARLRPRVADYDPDAVANGIAFDGHRLLVTGKRWPEVFALALEPPLPPHRWHASRRTDRMNIPPPQPQGVPPR